MRGFLHILEGSVQKSGDTVRVNVQLIKAANDSHLWADTFDRKLTEIFWGPSVPFLARAHTVRPDPELKERLAQATAKLD
jgi:hypothetical protein